MSAHDRAGLERLCRYVNRLPLAYGRLQRLDAERLSLALKTPWDNGTTQWCSRRMSSSRNSPPWCHPPGRALPPVLIHLIRYHGVLAPNAANRARIVPGPETTEGAAASSSPVAPGGPVQRLAWAQLLARVWGLDVTVCPRCGGRMPWALSDFPTGNRRLCESRRDSSLWR